MFLSSALWLPRSADLVLKAFKPRLFNDGHRISQADVDAQLYACNLVAQFDEEVGLRVSNHRVRIFMQHPKLVTMDQDKCDHTGRAVFLCGESTLIERRIDGDFVKFNSNTGWSCGDEAMDFLSHWTYAASRQNVLVCDLQGRKAWPGHVDAQSTFFYQLTDPAVMSAMGSAHHGIADLGPDGVADWFGKHSCGDLCVNHGLHRLRPQAVRQATARPARRAVQHTTFAFQ
jgi:hypothetical protein